MPLIRLACLLLALPFATFAATYPSDGDVIGDITHYKTQEGENLYAIAREHDLGIVEVLSANPGLDPWEIAAGTELALPTMHVLPDGPRDGIVINLSELRLFYYPGNGTVFTAPVGIGKEGWETPTGETHVALKRRNPSWTVPPSIHKEKPNLPAVVPPGPENPLGAHAMSLGWQGYVIHGTNRPYGIGSRASHGCIRMYPEDIAALFEMVATGTKVRVIDIPHKLGWRGDALYLEITPDQSQADTVASTYNPAPPVGIPQIYGAISKEAGTLDVEWYAVEKEIYARSGLPVVVARRTAPEPVRDSSTQPRRHP